MTPIKYEISFRDRNGKKVLHLFGHPGDDLDDAIERVLYKYKVESKDIIYCRERQEYKAYMTFWYALCLHYNEAYSAPLLRLDFMDIARREAEKKGISRDRFQDELVAAVDDFGKRILIRYDKIL